MELHVKIIGVVLVFLALVHGLFPKYFDWRNELTSVSLINRQLMYVHTFFIALLLLFMGALCITSASEIVETPLGRKLSLGIAVFWVARLVIQLFGYSSQLWRGKRFETVIHVLFVTLWTYLSTIFFLIYWNDKAGYV
jgi:hypothetical protein